jgi:hypothetical protein
MPFDGSVPSQVDGDTAELRGGPAAFGIDRGGFGERALILDSLASSQENPVLRIEPSAPPLTYMSGSFTLSAWVKLRQNVTDTERFVGQDGWFGLHMEDTEGASFGRATDQQTLHAERVLAGPLPLDAWVLLTGVVEDLGDGTSSIRLYLDGSLVDERVAATLFDVPSSCNFYVGTFTGTHCTGVASDTSNGWGVDGLIDDLRIYPRALSDGEIMTLAVGTPVAP